MVSPDGRYVYVASVGSHALAIFSRNRRTGTLTQLPGRRGCVRHVIERIGRGCTAARGMGGPAALALSPGGENLYVAAAGSDGLSVFRRNPRTGALRQLDGAAGCFLVREGGGCALGALSTSRRAWPSARMARASTWPVAASRVQSRSSSGPRPGLCPSRPARPGA